MRHHRKLLRRLRALFPLPARRGVVIERTPGGCWRVIVGRVTVAARLSRPGARPLVIDDGCVFTWENRRVDALREALRKRSREALT